MINGIERHIKDFSIEAIAESGQCFRIVPEENGAFCITALDRLLTVRQLDEEVFGFSCSDEEFDLVWADYFDLGTDYEVYRALTLPEDEYLKTAISFGSGIRILRQDAWEMLISFIISQRKSVPAIRTSVERLSERFGKPIGRYSDGRTAYAFPEADALAGADTEELSACGLGYRVGYVRNAARLVQSGELDLKRLEQLDTPQLIEALMKLQGVGIKVASCAALFGYHRLYTVPVDVWMKRVIDTVYNGSLPEEYKPYAGVLQQYMFNYARINKVGI